MREELNVDAEEEDEDEEEEEEEEEDEDEGTVIEAQLRHIWHLVSDGATESLEKNLPLTSAGLSGGTARAVYARMKTCGGIGSR